MGAINVEDLSRESYEAILDMVDEMERNGLVEIARERAGEWINKYSDCQYHKNFFYRPIGDFRDGRKM